MIKKSSNQQSLVFWNEIATSLPLKWFWSDWRSWFSSGSTSVGSPNKGPEISHLLDTIAWHCPGHHSGVSHTCRAESYGFFKSTSILELKDTPATATFLLVFSQLRTQFFAQQASKNLFARMSIYVDVLWSWRLIEIPLLSEYSFRGPALLSPELLVFPFLPLPTTLEPVSIQRPRLALVYLAYHRRWLLKRPHTFLILVVH